MFKFFEILKGTFPIFTLNCVIGEHSKVLFFSCVQIKLTEQTL